MMIIVPTESHLLEVLSALEGWRGNTDFKIKQILFKKGTGVPKTGVVQENVQFSVVFGKTNIYSGDLYTLQNGGVESELIKVVKKLSPVSSRVAYIAGAGSDILKVHDTSKEEASSEVTYFGFKADLEKFAKKFLVNVRSGSGGKGDGKGNGSGVEASIEVEEKANSAPVEYGPGRKEISREPEPEHEYNAGQEVNDQSQIGSSSDIERTKSSCSVEECLGSDEKKFCSSVVSKECSENIILNIKLKDSDIEINVANQFETDEDDFDEGAESGGEHVPEKEDEETG